MGFKEWMEEQEVDEGIMDTARKWGHTAALGAAMMAPKFAFPADTAYAPEVEPQSMKQVDPMQIKHLFDRYSEEKPTMSGDQWMQYAKHYPSEGRAGFVPNPKKPGQWIPAGGADSVRVQGISQVNNDELTRDDVGLTPWKGGKPMGKTKWSHMGQEQTPYGSSSRSTSTPIDGEALYRQAMQRSGK